MSTNLSKRVTKARDASRFASVMQRDLKGRPRTIILPGTNARLYHVIIRRTPVLSTELNIYTGAGLVKPHFAYKHITYHALAAIMVSAQERGYRVRWCRDEKSQHNLINLGGTPFTLVNHDNHGVRLYGVYVHD